METYYSIDKQHRIARVDTGINGVLFRPQYYTPSFNKWVTYTDHGALVQSHSIAVAYRHIHRSLRWMKAQGM